MIKKFLRKIPLMDSLISMRMRSKFYATFKSSQDYWKKRYQKGGNSGEGSYGRLALFKADVINQFIKEKDIKTVVEFGCGDGNQLKLMNYPKYTGYDVSEEAVHLCRDMFKSDSSKEFKKLEAYQVADPKAECALSLDVIYHLIEDNVFEAYMDRLVKASSKYLVIYSSNANGQLSGHVRHRNFSSWIEENAPEWKLIKKIDNKYPINKLEKETSFADFYLYEKITPGHMGELR